MPQQEASNVVRAPRDGVRPLKTRQTPIPAKVVPQRLERIIVLLYCKHPNATSLDEAKRQATAASIQVDESERHG